MKLKIIPMIILTMYICCCMSSQSVVTGKTLFSRDTVTLHFQKTYFNEQENLKIKFESLLNDSRCPIKAQCVWEGNAKILLTLAKNTNNNFILNTNRKFTRDTLLSGYSIALVELKPYPHADSLYSEKDYSAKLIISKQ